MGSRGGGFVLDSHAILAYFEGEASGAPVCTLIEEAERRRVCLYLSLINWGEVVYIVRREAEFLEADRVSIFDKVRHPAISSLSRNPAVNVSLTKELERLVNDKVKGGLYLSASEVVREALRLLEERDRLQQLRLEELRKEIRKGLDSGPARPFDVKALKARVRRAAVAEKRRKAG